MTANNNPKLNFHKALHKYGATNFVWQIIDMAGTHEDLNIAEIGWIKKLGSFENGYNMTAGGLGHLGRSLSKKEKEHLSILNKGKSFSPKTRKRIGDGLRGRR